MFQGCSTVSSPGRLGRYRPTVGSIWRVLLLVLIGLAWLPAMANPAGAQLSLAPSNPGERENRQREAELRLFARQLGDDAFSVREEASSRLTRAGDDAVSVLLPLLAERDVEVRVRASELLQRLGFPEPLDRLAWVRNYPDGLQGPPLLNRDGTQLLIAGPRVGVAALEPASGRRIWHFPQAPVPGAGLSIVGDVVLLPASESAGAEGADDGGGGVLIGLSAEDGRQRWHARIPGRFEGLTVGEDEDVFLLAEGGRMLARLEAATGAVLWQVGLPISGVGRPAVADGRVYVVSRAGVLLSLSDADGEILSQWEPEGDDEEQPVVADLVAVAGTGIVLMTRSGSVTALRDHGREVRWTRKIEGDGMFFSRPTVVGTTVYLSAGNRVSLVRAGDGGGNIHREFRRFSGLNQHVVPYHPRRLPQGEWNSVREVRDGSRGMIRVLGNFLPGTWASPVVASPDGQSLHLGHHRVVLHLDSQGAFSGLTPLRDPAWYEPAVTDRHLIVATSTLPPPEVMRQIPDAIDRGVDRLAAPATTLVGYRLAD